MITGKVENGRRDTGRAIMGGNSLILYILFYYSEQEKKIRNYNFYIPNYVDYMKSCKI